MYSAAALLVPTNRPLPDVDPGAAEDRVRILLLTQIVPFPPDSGPKIKTYNLLRYLASRHEVHLASFVRSRAEEAHADSLRSLCASVTKVPIQRSRTKDVYYLVRSLLTGRPFLIERDDSTAMRKEIDRLLSEHKFDAVHADQLTMGQFAIDLPVPLHVLDEHNAVWTIVRRSTRWEPWGAKRVAAELEWRKLRRYEGEICRRFDVTTVVSDDDRKALEEASGQPFRSATIPIAVDTHDFAFLPRTTDARHIISVATMFYPPNVEGVYWFATEVFPIVRRELPDVRFYIVGSRPPRLITRLAHPQSGIVVTGYVPDLEPLFQRSALTVVPLHSGSGMRVKILEAFSRGIPVASTAVGVEGIDARDGVHLLVADNPTRLARAAIQLIREPVLANRLARAGRDLVVDRYDWRVALGGLDEIYPAGLP